MNNLLLNTVLVSLIYSCSALHYEINRNLCVNINLSAIAIGEQQPNHNNKPEIMLIEDGVLWYWPKDSAYHERYWVSVPVPQTYGFSSVKRTFYSDPNECTKPIPSNFFVIYYDSTTTSHVFNIYDPSANDSWTYTQWLPLERHYLFEKTQIDLSIPLSSAFNWKNLIIIFQNDKYYSIRFNQTACDSSTDLKTTVEHLGPHQPLNSTYLSSFWYENEVYLFQYNQSLNNYTLEVIKSANISDEGKLQTDNVRVETSLVFNGFFNCTDPTPITDSTLETESESNSNGLSDTSESISVSDDPIDPTVATYTSDGTTGNGNQRQKNLPTILIIVLIISIIIALIVCIICCFCSKSKSKSTEKEDQEIGPTESQATKQVHKQSVPPTPPATKEEALPSKQAESNDTDSKKKIQESARGSPDNRNASPTTTGSMSSSRAQSIGSGIKATESLTDVEEGKPDKPFDGFPDDSSK